MIHSHRETMTALWLTSGRYEWSLRMLDFKNILAAYDQCVRVKSKEDCRGLAVRTVEPLVGTYLRSYDVCLQAFGTDYCRRYLGAESSSMCKKLLIALGVFTAWRIIKK